MNKKNDNYIPARSIRITIGEEELSDMADEKNEIKKPAKKKCRSERLKRVAKSPWSDYEKSIRPDKHRLTERMYETNEGKIFNEYFDKRENVKMVDKIDFIDESVLYKHKLGVTGLKLVDENSVVSCSFDSKICLYNIVEKNLKIFSGHYKGVTDIFIRNPFLYSISFDRKLKVWNLKDERCVFKVTLDVVPLKIYIETDDFDCSSTAELKQDEINSGKDQHHIAADKDDDTVRHTKKQRIGDTYGSHKRKKTQMSNHKEICWSKNIKRIIIGTSKGLSVFDCKFEELKSILIGFVLDIQSNAQFYFVLASSRKLYILEKTSFEICDEHCDVDCFSIFGTNLYMGNAKQISIYDMILKEYTKVSSAENSLLVTNANGTLVSVKIDGMLKIMKSLVDIGNIYNIDSVQSICFKNDNFIFIGTEGGLVKKYSMN